LLIAAITINAEPNETSHAPSFLDLHYYHDHQRAGFSVVGLLAPSSSDSFARYAASRSIALLIAVLFCLGVRLREGIAALAVVMSLDVECSAAPEHGVGKFRFSRGTESLALATTMPPFFGWLRKSSFLPKNCRKLLCQRITGSSKRITMCSTNIHARTQMQLTAHKSPT
jgi:hypothetical protein